MDPLGGYVLTQLFGDYSKDERLIMFIYEVFWVYFEWKLINAFLWRKWGVERIKVGKESIQIKKDVRSYGKLKNYFLENVENIQQIQTPTKSFAKVMGNSFWNMTEKGISFDYFGKLIAFGIQLNNKDAKKIVKLISAHLRKMA
jgi:hypothetical protein